MEATKTSLIEKIHRQVGSDIAGILRAMQVDDSVLNNRSDHLCNRCGKSKIHINKPDGHGYCNSCGVEFADYIDLIAHQRGWDKSTAIKEISKQLYIENGSQNLEDFRLSNPLPVAPKETPKEFPKAADGYCLHNGKIELEPMAPKAVAMFLARKPPIKESSFERVGIQRVSRRSNSEFAVPIYGKLNLTLCNWASFPSTGSKHKLNDGEGGHKEQSSIVVYSKLSKTVNDETIRHPFDRNGYFLTLDDRELITKGEPVENLIAIKLEGVSDFLSVCTEVDTGQGTRYLVFSNSDGCRSINEAGWFAEMLGKLTPKEVWIVHDSDIDGQAGAVKWAKELSKIAPVKNVRLPFEIKDKKGKDLRDYLNEGGTFADLVGIAQVSEFFDESKQVESVESTTPNTEAPTQPETKQAETQKNAPAVKPIGITELSRSYTELREELIQGLLRRSEVCNVIASPKVGKSNLTGGLALSVATGRSWLGLDTMQGRVLMVDNELHLETIAYRLHRIRKAMGLEEPELDGQVDVLSLRGHLCDIDGLGLLLQGMPKDHYIMIVLDALYRFLPEGTSENDNAQMTALYNKLDAYAAMTGASIVCVHHATKGDQSTKGITDMGSGAGSIARAADTHIAIRPHEQDGLAVMECVTRSFAQPGAMSIRMDYPLWVPVTTPAILRRRTMDQSTRDQETDKSVIETLNTLPNAWWSASQIRNRMGCGNEKILRSLARLKVQEAVTCEIQNRKNKDVECFKIEKKEISKNENAKA
jgi:hypothetical protein